MKKFLVNTAIDIVLLAGSMAALVWAFPELSVGKAGALSLSLWAWLTWYVRQHDRK